LGSSLRSVSFSLRYRARSRGAVARLEEAMRIPILIALIALAFPSLSGAVDGEDPAAEVLVAFEPMLASIDAILEDPEASPDQKRALIEREFDIWIDYATMAQAALGPRVAEFSALELASFASEFERYFQHFYVSRMALRDAASREAVEARYDPESGAVTVRVPGAAAVSGPFPERTTDPRNVDALFRLLRRYGDWRIVDVRIGNVGVTKLFRQQFESLLRTETPEQLIARLRDRNQQLEARNPLDPNRLPTARQR
jgi:phospholipid transport system substrate-binding protein